MYLWAIQNNKNRRMFTDSVDIISLDNIQVFEAMLVINVRDACTFCGTLSLDQIILIHDFRSGICRMLRVLGSKDMTKRNDTTGIESDKVKHEKLFTKTY